MACGWLWFVSLLWRVAMLMAIFDGDLEIHVTLNVCTLASPLTQTLARARTHTHTHTTRILSLCLSPPPSLSLSNTHTHTHTHTEPHTSAPLHSTRWNKTLLLPNTLTLPHLDSYSLPLPDPNAVPRANTNHTPVRISSRQCLAQLQITPLPSFY